MAGQPVVFAPGAVCPVGYLCIPGMEPMKLPDVQPDIQSVPDDPGEPDVQGFPDDVIPPTLPYLPIDQPPVVQEPPVNIPPVVVPPVVPPVEPPVVPPVVVPSDDPTEDLGTPWYMQVIKPQIPREPWMVSSSYGIMPSTDLLNTSPGATSDFYAYTGPSSGIPEEVAYDLFYGGDRWNRPQSLLDAIEASMYKEDVEGGVTAIEWPGMESWLASSGIPEADWNSSLYKGHSGYKYAEPQSVSYPWSYDVDVGLGDLTPHFRPDGRNFKWGD